MEIVMTLLTTRRGFIQRSAAAGFLAGLSGLESLGSLPRVAAADAQLDPDAVPLPSEIEPLVRLLEETPRERLLEEVAARIRGGLSLSRRAGRVALGRGAQCAAAAQRGLQIPCGAGGLVRTSGLLGFPRFAALAAHLLGAGLLQIGPGPGRARRQLDHAPGGRVGGAGSPSGSPGVEPTPWTAGTKPRPTPRWPGVARSAGAHETFELFFRYGARDFRSIGHKAIFVAGSYRVLQVIGWRYAEPVLRSLAYALLMHEGTNPTQADAEADRPGRENLARAGEIRASGWTASRMTAPAPSCWRRCARRATTKSAAWLSPS